ncbi:MAG TPA: glycerophosphodiester phosphodiesterase family protein [Beijerinckiaceae bacterium]
MSLDWLVARPIAHRGWHDRPAGRIENAPAALAAAVEAGFAIEIDVQAARDGEAMVFHDATLDRLVGRPGAVRDHDAADLAAMTLRDGRGDAIPTLPSALALVAGRTPLVVEIKSAFDGDMRLADRVAALAAAYGGPIALKSFDPDVIAHLRAAGVGVPLGVVAEAAYDHPEWAGLAPERRRALAAFLHWSRTRPDFLSWNVNDWPHPTPHLLRAALGRPVMTWTVRTPAQWAQARRFADQAVFEGAPL